MKTPTTHSIKRAYSAAVKRLQAEAGITATVVSAGFIIPDGQPKQKRKGFQVFVRVCKYSEELLINKPLTGGLLCNADPVDL